MKILAISNSFESFINHRKKLINNLSTEHNLLVIGGEDNYIEDIEQLNINYKIINIKTTSKNLFYDICLIYQIYKIFSQFKPELVLNFTIKPNIYGSLIANIFNVPNINNVTGMGRGFLSGFLKKILIPLYKYTNKKTYKFYFQNGYDKNFFIKKKISNLQNSFILPGSGVDLDYFYKCEYKIKNKIQIYFIGRIIKEKGIYEFIDLANIVSKISSNIQFNIIGSFEKKSKKIKNLIVKNDIINYLGYKKDIRSELAKAHLVVLPSYSEGLPHILLEAASMCKPLLASDIPGNNYVVKNNINGFLFKPKVANDFLSKFNMFLNLTLEEKNEMSKNSRIIAKKNFDEKIILNQYKKDIENLNA